MSKRKADSFTESWLCVDCGVDTAPGIPDGPTIRSQLALLGECQTSIDSDSEVYTVRRAAWKQARMKPFGGCLCIGCLEERLGRKLKPKDFEPDHPFNKFAKGTPRLLDRRRRNAEAEIERLREAKRRALMIADERSKENVELRREIERLWAALEGR